MRVLTVIGNRPQFIKAAAVSPPLRAIAEEILVHTGQHHDDRMSAVFFAELGVPAPEIELSISGGSNTSQTARMLAALEPVIADAAPDAVLVYGDTNSTLAGTLAAVQAGVPVAHVEAGMRSYDRTMPEEVNRVVCDHLSGLLLCSSERAAANLAAEGIGSDGRPEATVEVVGDVMVDVAGAVRSRVQPGVGKRWNYVFVTVHRAANVDNPDRLARVVELLHAIADRDLFVVFALHPRTRARLNEFGLMDKLDSHPRVRLREPQSYVGAAGLLTTSRAVVTDSGGLQKEAYFAGVPCITLRDTTEWTETVEAGWNTLVDLDIDRALRALDAPVPAERPPLYGDGHAGQRVADALIRWHAA